MEFFIKSKIILKLMEPKQAIATFGVLPRSACKPAKTSTFIFKACWDFYSYKKIITHNLINLKQALVIRIII